MQAGIYYIDGDFKFTGGNIRCVDGPTMKCTGPASLSPTPTRAAPIPPAS